MQGANAVKLNERPVKVGRVAEITGYSAGLVRKESSLAVILQNIWKSQKIILDLMKRPLKNKVG